MSKIFFDSPQLGKNYTNFRIILNVVSKLVDFPECPRHFYDCPLFVKKSTNFRIVKNLVTKLVNQSVSLSSSLLVPHETALSHMSLLCPTRDLSVPNCYFLQENGLS